MMNKKTMDTELFYPVLKQAFVQENDIIQHQTHFYG